MADDDEWPPRHDNTVGPGGRLYYGEVPRDAVPIVERSAASAQPPAPPAPRSELPRQQRGHRERQAADSDRVAGRRYIFPGDVFGTAKAFGMDQWQTPDGLRTAHHHRSEFFVWDGAAFRAVDVETVKSRLWPWLAASWQRDPEGGDDKPVLPKSQMVGAIIEGLRAASQLNNELEPPLWISGSIYAPRDLIVCKNTMLHWPSAHLVANTPNFFTTNSLDFDYRPDLGAQPVEFLRSLDQLWSDDRESIETLR